MKNKISLDAAKIELLRRIKNGSLSPENGQIPIHLAQISDPVAFKKARLTTGDISDATQEFRDIVFEAERQIGTDLSKAGMEIF